MYVEKDEIQVYIGGGVCKINRIDTREVCMFYRNSRTKKVYYYCVVLDLIVLMGLD